MGGSLGPRFWALGLREVDGGKFQKQHPNDVVLSGLELKGGTCKQGEALKVRGLNPGARKPLQCRSLTTAAPSEVQ